MNSVANKMMAAGNRAAAWVYRRTRGRIGGVDLSLPPGTTQRVSFTAGPGTYTFFCSPHPDMQGLLVTG